LLYAVSGSMRVRLGTAAWIVSPRTGVWVPCGVPHQVEAVASVSYRSVFVSPVVAQAIPAYRAPITIDALTREIILEATTFGAHYRPDSAESRLIEVLHDRLQRVPAEVMPIPLPRDTRTRRICDALLEHPDDNHSLETWGRLVGASARTLARLFLRETGMTFSDWVRCMRLSLALDRLIQGETVTTVALDLGYASPSAFCAMFRRTLGTSPSHYRS
jgi:AraC-like DNA-binding protein